MPDIGAMKELLGRVERATGADGELDTAIMALFYERKRKFIGVRYVGGGRAMSMVWVDSYSRKWVSTHAYEFTASLDRCVALIEKVLPRHWWVVGKDNEAWVWGPDEGLEVSEPQATAPLALLAALLRALILIEERKALAEGEVR